MGRSATAKKKLEKHFGMTNVKIITAICLPEIQTSVSVHIQRAHSEIHSSLHNCGSPLRNLPHSTLLVPKFGMWLLDL